MLDLLNLRKYSNNTYRSNKLLRLYEKVTRNKWKDFIVNLTLGVANTVFINLSSEDQDSEGKQPFKTLSIATTSLLIGSQIFHILGFLLYKNSISENKIIQRSNVISKLDYVSKDYKKELLLELYTYQLSQSPSIYKEPSYLVPLIFNSVITVSYALTPFLKTNIFYSYILHYASSLLGCVSDASFANYCLKEKNHDKMLLSSLDFLIFIAQNKDSDYNYEVLIQKYFDHLNQGNGFDRKQRLDSIVNLYIFLDGYQSYQLSRPKSLLDDGEPIGGVLSSVGLTTLNGAGISIESIQDGPSFIATLKKNIENLKDDPKENIVFQRHAFNSKLNIFHRDNALEKAREVGKAVLVRLGSQLSLNLLFYFIYSQITKSSTDLEVGKRSVDLVDSKGAQNFDQIDSAYIVTNIENLFDENKICGVSFNKDVLSANSSNYIPTLLNRYGISIDQFYDSYHSDYDCEGIYQFKDYFQQISNLYNQSDFSSAFARYGMSFDKDKLYSLSPNEFEPQLSNQVNLYLSLELNNGCRINFSYLEENTLQYLFSGSQYSFNEDCLLTASNSLVVDTILVEPTTPLPLLYSGFIKNIEGTGFNFTSYDFKSNHSFDKDTMKIMHTLGESIGFGDVSDRADKYIISYDTISYSTNYEKTDNWPFYQDKNYHIIKFSDHNNCTFLLEKEKADRELSIILQNEESCLISFKIRNYLFCGLKLPDKYGSPKCFFPDKENLDSLLLEAGYPKDLASLSTTTTNKAYTRSSEAPVITTATTEAPVTTKATTEALVTTKATTTEAPVTTTATTEAPATTTATTEAPVTTTATTTEALVTTTATTEAPATTIATTEAPVTTKATTEAPVITTATTEELVTTIATTEAPVTTKATTEAPVTTTVITEASTTILRSLPSPAKKEIIGKDITKVVTKIPSVISDYLAPFLFSSLYNFYLRKCDDEDLRKEQNSINKKFKFQEFLIFLTHACSDYSNSVISSSTNVFSLASSLTFILHSFKNEEFIEGEQERLAKKILTKITKAQMIPSGEQEITFNNDEECNLDKPSSSHARNFRNAGTESIKQKLGTRSNNDHVIKINNMFQQNNLVNSDSDENESIQMIPFR